jgi:AbiJ N-terminal domain 4
MPSGTPHALFLEKRPDPGNWSEYPNVWDEAQSNVYNCEWFQVYDIIERIWNNLKAGDDQSLREPKAPAFEQAINDFFATKGIGWQLVNGEIVVRGTEAFEATVKTAKTALEDSGRPTAAKHIHEALQALSRRPEPNLPGAVYLQDYVKSASVLSDRTRKRRQSIGWIARIQMLTQ